MTAIEPYEVYAIKYAHNASPTRKDVFLGGDQHDSAMPLDYFVWVIRNSQRIYVVDTGFTQTVADRRKRTLLHSPEQALALLGLPKEEVKNIIITHLHYDHAGGLSMFPEANVHVQQTEMAFVTGPCMCHRSLRDAFEVDDVVEMVRRLFRGKLACHHGDEEIAPGLSLHHIGGHTAGCQVVRIWTRRGWLVLASDVSHFYDMLFSERAFTWTLNLAEHFQGLRKVLALASSPDHIIPGHDPLVMLQYPAVSQPLEGIAVRLDDEPKFSAAARFPEFQHP